MSAGKDKKNGQAGAKKQQPAETGGSGTSWTTIIVMVALLGLSAALTVTVHKLNQQLEQERSAISSNQQELEAEVASARTTATVANSEKLEALSKMQQAQQDMAKSMLSEEEVKKKLSMAEEYNKVALNKVNVVKEELAEKTKVAEAELAAKQDLQEKLDKLTAVKEKGDEIIKQFESQASKALADVQTKEAAILKLQDDLKASQAKNEETQGLLQKAVTEVTSTKGELAGSKQAAQATEQKMRELQAEIEKQKKAVKEHEGYVATRDNVIKQRDGVIKALEGRVGELEPQLNKVVEESRTKDASIQKLQVTLQQEQEQAKTNIQTLNALKDTVSERDATVLELQQKWQAAIDEKARLEADLKTAQEKR